MEWANILYSNVKFLLVTWFNPLPPPNKNTSIIMLRVVIDNVMHDTLLMSQKPLEAVSEVVN